MTVFALNPPVFTMDNELSALVFADLTPSVDCFLLRIEVAAAAGRAFFLDVPATVGVGYNMM